MTTYPLPTLAPTVSATGITAPAYSDILLSLQASYQGIYGSDAYLAADSQDGQWLAVLAAAINDTNMAIIATYNDYSPATAVGVGLSSVVKTNGITRQIPSNSTATVVLTGQNGSTITGGIVGDNLNLNTQWSLPSPLTFSASGSITTTATSLTLGAGTAAAGALTVMLTPTAGWQSVTNPAEAFVGAPVETDYQLRQRQALSTELPSQTILQGIVGAVLGLPGVTAAVPYENTTNSTDANGLPPHSFSIVVIGGLVQSIVNAIGLKKSPGSQSYGNTNGTYVDSSGNSLTVNYTVPAQQTILVNVTLTPLTGYTSAIGAEIQAAVAAYISSLGSGKSVLLNRLNVPANLAGPYATPASPTDSLTYEITGIAAAISPAVPGSSDVVIAYNQIAECTAANVTVIT